MQAMDKSHNIFLKGEIRRIVNLNERIDTSSFLLETLDSNTTDNINKIRDYLLQKNIKDDVINKFINDTLTAQFNAGKCGKGNGVKCEHLSKYILNKIIDPNTKLSNEDDINKFYDPIDKKDPKDLKLEVEAALGIGTTKPTGFKPSDVFVTQLVDRMDAEQELMMAHFDVDESEFEKKLIGQKKELLRGEFCPECKSEDEILRRFESWLGDIRSKSASDKMAQETADKWIEELVRVKESKKVIITDEKFEEIKNNLRGKLMDGTYCKGCKKKSTRDKWRREVLNMFGADRLTQSDVDILMRKFDSEVYSLLKQNQGDEWANKMRSGFDSSLKSGEICPNCDPNNTTKDDLISAANEEMGEIKKYSVSGEKEAVEKMSNFLERAGKAHQIYKDFMDMWGLSDSDFGDSTSKGTKNKDGDYTFKEGDRVEIKVEYDRGDDRRKIFNVFTGSDNFTNSWLSGVFKKKSIGEYNYWFVSKKNGRETVAIGLPIKTPVIEKGKQYNVVFQKLKSTGDYGKGEKVLDHSTPVKIQVK